ncbi:MAG: antibiotic biosynthesis monooxygenase [Gemmatimonadales bacterium]
MVCRIWSGWTTEDNADAYEQLLLDEIAPGIVAKRLSGFREMQVLREITSEGEVRFTTLMWFESLGDIKAFAGEDYATAVIPLKARALLLRFDAQSRHAEVLATLPG